MTTDAPVVHEPFDFLSAPPPINVQTLNVLIEIRDLLKAQAVVAVEPNKEPTPPAPTAKGTFGRKPKF